MGATYLGAVLHLGTCLPQQLDCRYMKARTMRAAFREFLCNGWAQTKDSGLLLLRGELVNSVLADLGNRIIFVEVFSEPGQQVLRDNRLKSGKK